MVGEALFSDPPIDPQLLADQTARGALAAITGEPSEVTLGELKAHFHPVGDDETGNAIVGRHALANGGAGVSEKSVLRCTENGLFEVSARSLEHGLGARHRCFLLFGSSAETEDQLLPALDRLLGLVKRDLCVVLRLTRQRTAGA